MTLPAYVTAHKGDATTKHFYLVKIDCSPVQYLTDCDLPISYGGNMYSVTRSLSVTGIGASAGGRDGISGNIQVGNADAAFGILVSAFVGTSAMPYITIYDAWLDVTASNVVVQAAYPVVIGRVASPSWDSSWVSFSIAPYIDGEAEKVPWRMYSTNCSYRIFKGAQCGYAGAGTSCDRTYTTCGLFGNTARFGGFRYLLPDEVEWEAGLQGTVKIKLTKRYR